MRCIPPNPGRVGYIVPIHEPLDRPLYMGSHIHQQYDIPLSQKKNLKGKIHFRQMSYAWVLIGLFQCEKGIFNAFSSKFSYLTAIDRKTHTTI